ncbi:MAG: hypothetical protein WC683_10570 [bacterium]
MTVRKDAAPCHPAYKIGIRNPFFASDRKSGAEIIVKLTRLVLEDEWPWGNGESDISVLKVLP